MLIPNGPEGSPAADFPTMYASRLRAYGAAGFRLIDQEESKGCPRLYRKRYVEKAVPRTAAGGPLEYGGMIHSALFAMEEHAIGPEQALERVWPASLDIAFWNEAVADLAKYLERGGPMARFGTIAVETDLYAPLYVDDDFGPVWYGGRIDWLGIDVEVPEILHHVDYKTNRFPPSKDDVAGDVQLKGYDFLVRENWATFMPTVARPNVVAHLDAIKWYEIEHRYRDQEIEEWREWASAIARTILRDADGKPVLNDGCGWCPVKHSCPAYQALPDVGTMLLEKAHGTTLAEMYRWRTDAAGAVKALKAGIEEIDAAISAETQSAGEVVVPGRRWFLDVAWENDIDVEELARRIGVQNVLRMAKPSKAAIKRWIDQQPDPYAYDGLIDEVTSSQPSGTKVKSEKIKEET